MTTIKTNELTGSALDWAVAKCEGKDNDIEVHGGNVLYGRCSSGFVHYTPSTNWAKGGPIIEREAITLASPNPIDAEWCAMLWGTQAKQAGTTPLIAAMRCYVASKLGNEVEIPEELV